MRLELRIIAAMAVALSFVPALRADGPARPAAPAMQDGQASSRVTPASAVKARPDVAAAGPSSLPAAIPPSRGENVYTPNFELFVGYSNFRAFPGRSAGNLIDWVSGGSTSFAYNKNSHLGLVVDLGRYHANKVRTGAPISGGVVDASGNVYTFMGGPRLSFRHDRFTPFAQALVGMAHNSEVRLDGCTGSGCVVLPSQNALAVAAGGGLDVTLSSRIALRLFQAEYVMTRFREPTSIPGRTGTQNDVRLSVGIVFRFGVKLP